MSAAKRRGGRPSKFRDEFCDQARKYCLLGATNEDLAKLFEVSFATVDKWIAEKPEFSGPIKAGREVADAKVGDSLFQRANGYTVREEKIFCNASGEVTRVETLKHYPPDTVACIFWLKNRQKDYWRDRHEQSVDVTHREVPAERLSREELQRIAAEGRHVKSA